MNLRMMLSVLVFLCLTPIPSAGAAPTRAVFTAAQAARGKVVYETSCSSCHGESLKGATAPALAGADFATAWTPSSASGSFATTKPTIDDLDFIIRTTMPLGAAQSLPSADYEAVLSYVLQQNGYVSGKRPLRAGSPALRQTLQFAAVAEQKHGAAPARLDGDPLSVPKAGTGPTQAELDDAGSSTRNWLYHTHNYKGTRYVALDDINTSNASSLKAVCTFQVGDSGNFQTGPVVYNGTMYLTTARGTLALDATTCKPKWRYTWKPLAGEVWNNNRGVALKDGYAVRGTSDGYIIALNAQTGALVWAVKAADPALGENFTMAPMIYEDMVLIGPAGSENAISGWIGAFRLTDGKALWRFNTVPGAVKEGSPSWGNPKKIRIGGGALWTPPTLDTAKGELVIAVTNPAPDLPAGMRPGDNRYTNSAVGLDVHTGKLLWFRQMVPNDSHDWDLTQVSPMFTAKVAGKEKSLIATVGKDGILRTLDRETHEPIYATPVTTIRNAELPVTQEGVDVCPGVLGGVEWNGPALNPELGMLYVNAVDWCTHFTTAKSVRYIPGRMYMGGTAHLLDESQGWLTAVDAVTGSVRWKYRSPRPMVAAVTATKGNLVLTGELSGDVLALDARDGSELFRFNTGGGIGGGVVTYREAGRQYIAVMSGRPSSFWTNEISGSPTVYIFALP